MNSSGRRIGPGLATVLVAGNMIGSGIFFLPTSVAPIGAIALLGWVAASVGAVLVALGLARISGLRPLPGGPSAQAEASLGRPAGFVSYVLYLLICWVGNLGVAVAAVGYLANSFPLLGAGWPSTLAVIGLFCLMTLLNIIGPRRVCQFDTLTIAAGLLPILLVATWGWARFDPSLFHAAWNPGQLPLHKALPDSVLLVFWAFLGLESASVAAAVVENPARNVPLATVGGVLLAAVVYIAASAAIFGLVPREVLMKSTAPFAEATRVLFGPLTAGLVAWAAFAKTAGTLSGWILLGAQTAQAAAARGFLPRSLARVNAGQAPVRALVAGTLFTVVMAVLTRSGSLARQFEFLAEASVLMTLLVYILALLPAFTERGLRERFGPGFLWSAAGGVVFCTAGLLGSPANMLVALLVTVTSSLLIYATRLRISRR